MAEGKDGPISWYSPDPRAILPFANFRVSNNLKRLVQRGKFDVRFDTAFREVMSACADRSETWISGKIIDVYCDLFELGHAHSVECYLNDNLVGGLYGVSIGGAYFGESMFHRERDASKVALVYLVEHLRVRGFELLDTQFTTSHLEQFGVIEIPREEYEDRLIRAIDKKVSW